METNSIFKNDSKPIIFDELGDNYNPLSKGYRPFIIFYDENKEVYFYLKARSTGSKINNKFSKIGKGEFLVEKSWSENGLFKNDSYVDCSQIFKIDSKLLESLVVVDNDLLKNTLEIENKYKNSILNMINKNLNDVPPYISFVEVYKMGDKIKAQSLYLCNEKLDSIYENQKPGEYDNYNFDIYKSEGEFLKEFELNKFKHLFETKIYNLFNDKDNLNLKPEEYLESLDATNKKKYKNKMSM